MNVLECFGKHVSGESLCKKFISLPDLIDLFDVQVELRHDFLQTEPWKISSLCLTFLFPGFSGRMLRVSSAGRCHDDRSRSPGKKHQ